MREMPIWRASTRTLHWFPSGSLVFQSGVQHLLLPLRGAHWPRLIPRLRGGRKASTPPWANPLDETDRFAAQSHGWELVARPVGSPHIFGPGFAGCCRRASGTPTGAPPSSEKPPCWPHPGGRARSFEGSVIEPALGNASWVVCRSWHAESQLRRSRIFGKLNLLIAKAIFFSVHPSFGI